MATHHAARAARRCSGQVLELDGDRAILQVFGPTQGIDLRADDGRIHRRRCPTDRLARPAWAVCSTAPATPIDGGPPIAADQQLDINGLVINPCAREEPSDFIQTGISTIDGLNSPRARPEAADLQRLRAAGERDRRADRHAGRRSAPASGSSSSSPRWA